MVRPTLALSLLSVFLFACQGSDPASADAKGAAPASAKADADGGAVADPQPEPATGDEAVEGGKVEPGTETGEGEEGEEGDAAPLPAEFEKLEVDVCDAYVADYVACIDSKVPEAEREAQRRIVFQNIEAWKQMKASGPSAAQGLQIGCRSAREQAKRETQAWSCEW